MGHKYISATGTVYNGKMRLTSVVCTPSTHSSVSALCSLYEATSAASAKRVMRFLCGTNVQTVSWSDPKGIELERLYAVILTATATIVWD
jgi:hypothetical protein